MFNHVSMILSNTLRREQHLPFAPPIGVGGRGKGGIGRAETQRVEQVKRAELVARPPPSWPPSIESQIDPCSRGTRNNLYPLTAARQ